jgi:hypothetical protein
LWRVFGCIHSPDFSIPRHPLHNSLLIPGAAELRYWLIKRDGQKHLKPYTAHQLCVEHGYYADGSRRCADYSLRRNGCFVCSFDLKVKEDDLGARTTILEWFEGIHDEAAQKYVNYKASIVSFRKEGNDTRRFRILENIPDSDGEESD